jgi:hypothetical protein
MSWSYNSQKYLSPQEPYGTIEIDFVFEKDEEFDYEGISTLTFRNRGRQRWNTVLPMNEKGRMLLELYKVAFKRRSLFTVEPHFNFIENSNIVTQELRNSPSFHLYRERDFPSKPGAFDAYADGITETLHALEGINIYDLA